MILNWQSGKSLNQNLAHIKFNSHLSREISNIEYWPCAFSNCLHVMFNFWYMFIIWQYIEWDKSDSVFFLDYCFLKICLQYCEGRNHFSITSKIHDTVDPYFSFALPWYWWAVYVLNYINSRLVISWIQFSNKLPSDYIDFGEYNHHYYCLHPHHNCTHFHQLELFNALFGFSIFALPFVISLRDIGCAFLRLVLSLYPRLYSICCVRYVCYIFMFPSLLFILTSQLYHCQLSACVHAKTKYICQAFHPWIKQYPIYTIASHCWRECFQLVNSILLLTAVGIQACPVFEFHPSSHFTIWPKKQSKTATIRSSRKFCLRCSKGLSCLHSVSLTHFSTSAREIPTH